MDKPTGRPTDYNEDVVCKAYEYIENYEKHGHAIPSVAGLAKVINRARSTIYKWADENDKVFSDILSELLEEQEQVLLSKGLNSDFNSTITKLILTKHGYSDKQETDLTTAGKEIKVEPIRFVAPSDD